jgi:thiol-disulfide isomerase/thioredoxin/uncharacterized membrane protein YphA (DoxX/SURF4 family)
MVEIIVLLARVLIAIVFAVSGLAKLVSIRQSRISMQEFGVPAPIAGIVTGLLITVELAVPLLILRVPTAWYGGVIALALLAIFCIMIAVNLLRHRRPHCNCFGQLHSAPIGWQMLARNIVLGVVAVAIVLKGRENGALSAIGWARSLGASSTTSLVLASIILVLLVVIAACLVQIVRQQGRVLLRLDALEQAAVAEPGQKAQVIAPELGLPLGTKAPEFVLNALDGGRTRLADLLKRNKPVLLLFSHPGCGPCQSLFPDIGNWQNDLEEDLTIAVISEGPAADNRSHAKKHDIRRLLLQKEREIAERYLANGTPSGVLVAANGTITSHLAQGTDAIRSLVGAIASQRHAGTLTAETVAVGDPAPDLSFDALSGEKIALSNLRGQKTMLLFWNPRCGFCQRMLPELKDWEATALPGSPRLIVLSTGAPSENRAMGLRSTIVLDVQSRAASAFRAHGTPMAILLDGEGRVASPVAAGKDAVFELANQPRSSIN